MADSSQLFAAPIPGANYTSDTKNYPWHRPPEVTTLDDGIELAYKKLTDEDAAEGLLTMMELGMPISSLTFSFVMSGVAAGKWTPDFAILLAGPVSHIMYLMAKGYGIDVEMGLEGGPTGFSKAFFNATKKDKSRVDAATKDIPIDVIKENAGQPAMSGGGFMSMIGEEPEEDLSDLDDLGDVEEGLM